MACKRCPRTQILFMLPTSSKIAVCNKRIVNWIELKCLGFFSYFIINMMEQTCCEPSIDIEIGSVRLFPAFVDLAKMIESLHWPTWNLGS